MTDRKRPGRPARLGPAGRALWGRLVSAYDFDARELAVVEAAARQADDVRALEDVLAADGPMTVGAQGQPRLSQVVGEVRQSRLALARLLGELALPDGDERPMTAKQLQMQRTARVRWDRAAATRELG